MYTMEHLWFLFLLATFSCTVVVDVLAVRTYNVMDYGALGDGTTDDTKAFLAAWDATCGDDGDPTLLIPDGKTFLLGNIEFRGPCQSHISVRVNGNLLRPNVIWGNDVYAWMLFIRFNGLTIEGSGQIDGQGQVYWTCKQEYKCNFAPNSLSLLNNENVVLRGLKSVNSAGFHVSFGFSKSVVVHDLTLTAPDDSPNTDGIHVQSCEEVQILDSTIGTGDDCVSLGDGCVNVTVSDITCGPGHGISVGSLGRRGSEAKVEQIKVMNSHISNTQNGVRIKSWQGGSGYAKGILFQNINFTAVQNPITIDQYYCPHQICSTHPSAVQISDVRFIGITGTTVSDNAISLNCSASVPCSDIFMTNIHIQRVPEEGNVTSHCINARGTKDGVLVPDVPCLSLD